MTSKVRRVLSLILIILLVTVSLYSDYFSQFLMGMTFEEVKKIISRDNPIVFRYNLPLKDIVNDIEPLADKETHPYAQYPEEIKISYLFDRASYFGAMAEFRFFFSPKTKLLSIIGIVWTLDNDEPLGHAVRNKITLSLWKEPEQIGEGYRYIWPFKKNTTRSRIFLEYGKKGEVRLYFYGYVHFQQFVKEVEEMKSEYDRQNQQEKAF